MLHLIAVQSDVGCEGEGNDLEEGFHTKDCCDASIQSIDDLKKQQPHQEFENLFILYSQQGHGLPVIPCLMRDNFLPRTAYASTGHKSMISWVTWFSDMIIALR